jgi:uncharacterized protein (TIGR01244 family)
MNSFYRRSGVSLSLAFIFSLFFSVSADASDKAKHFNHVEIKNFGQVDENLYRGGQPEKEEFQVLAAIGVKTVINLREDAKSYERSATEAAGMRYIHIPMSDSQYPVDAQIEQFLKTVNDKANGPYYVHCAGGRHRTGVTVAVYRFENYGWDIDKVYSEMKAYDFYTRWGHGSMKDYVFDYDKKMRLSKTAPYHKANQPAQENLGAGAKN